MHLYNLPWPKDELLGLGEIRVKMRVTLSYFIEPGPGEVGWNDRYRYPSHMLRFEVNNPEESEEDFIRRINYQAREDETYLATSGSGGKWLIGTARNTGSVHSDIWQGTAAQLASSNFIGIYPVAGWWRNRSHLNCWNKQTRYALIVSIYTQAENVDIYTPVATKVGLPISVETIIN